MISAISLIASIVVLMILVLLPKKMHLFELIFIGMVFHYLYTYQFSIFTNMKWFTLSSDVNKVISSLFIRFILFPVVVLLCLQIYLTLRSLYAKLTLILVFSVLLGLIQYVLKATGIVKQSTVVAIWTIGVWFIILLLCTGAMKWFRRIIGKELILP